MGIFCPHCGKRDCPGCSSELDPPRFCPACGKRCAVKVFPDHWTATCPEHGPIPRDPHEFGGARLSQ